MKPFVTLIELRDEIAEVIAANEKAYDVPTVCDSLGLNPGTEQSAFASKRVYIRSRIITKSLCELIELGDRILERYPDASDLENMLKLLKISSDGVKGGIKNLIFAADGPKPELVLIDALNNTIEIVKHADRCLVYDSPISQTGLLWTQLVAWWAKLQNLSVVDKSAEYSLFHRLKKSLASPPEHLLFDTYFKAFHKRLGEGLPALIPQVYLHYDPMTFKDLQSRKRIPRQRMDFLLLFSNSDRVVIEVDGKQHYADGDVASARKYAEMVTEDRRLRLLGYESLIGN